MKEYDLIDTFFEMLNQKKEEEGYDNKKYQSLYKKFLYNFFATKDAHDVDKMHKSLNYVKEKYIKDLDVAKTLYDFIASLDDKKQIKKYVDCFEKKLNALKKTIRSNEVDLPANWMEYKGVSLTKKEQDEINNKYLILSSKNQPKDFTKQELDAYIVLIENMINNSKSMDKLLEVAKSKAETTFKDLGVMYEDILREKAPQLFEFIENNIKHDTKIILDKRNQERNNLMIIKKEIADYKIIREKLKHNFDIVDEVKTKNKYNRKNNDYRDNYTKDNNDDGGLCSGSTCWN